MKFRKTLSMFQKNRARRFRRHCKKHLTVAYKDPINGVGIYWKDIIDECTVTDPYYIPLTNGKRHKGIVINWDNGVLMVPLDEFEHRIERNVDPLYIAK